MKNLILFILALVILGGAWLLVRRPASAPVIVPTTNTTTNIDTNQSGIAPLTDSSIVIDLPKANSTTTSPITLTGRARGNWFFEATAPVTVIDVNGKTLGQGNITATGDWTTTDYIPFTGSVSYTLPVGTSTEGFILFMNDNPSGDPTNGVSVKVPIRFKR